MIARYRRLKQKEIEASYKDVNISQLSLKYMLFQSLTNQRSLEVMYIVVQKKIGICVAILLLNFQSKMKILH